MDCRSKRKTKSYKLLEEKRIFMNLDQAKNSYYDTKSTIHTLNFIKITQVYSAKDTVKKTKRQAKDWGKYLKITYPTNTVCRIHKEL